MIRAPLAIGRINPRDEALALDGFRIQFGLSGERSNDPWLIFQIRDNNFAMLMPNP